MRPVRGSLGPSGAAYRASGDDRCVSYDELFLLFKRFRGPAKSLIGYVEPHLGTGTQPSDSLQCFILRFC